MFLLIDFNFLHKQKTCYICYIRTAVPQYSDYTAGWNTGVWFSAGTKIFSFLLATASRWTLGPSQPPIQWVPGVKQRGRKAYLSPPSHAEVENAWSYTFTCGA